MVTRVAFEKRTAAKGAAAEEAAPSAAACACAEAATVATAPKQTSDAFAATAHVKASAEATETWAPLGAKVRAELELKHESAPEGESAHVWARPGLAAEKAFGAGSTHMPVWVERALSRLHSPQQVVFWDESEAQSVAAPAEREVKGVQRRGDQDPRP